MSIKFLIIFTLFNYTLSSGEKLKNSSSCTPYIVKSGDGLWNLSNNWCQDGNGWAKHIFTDSNCTSKLTSANIKVGETIYFGPGCSNPDTPSAGKNIFISYISDKDIYNTNVSTSIWPKRLLTKDTSVKDWGS